MPNLKLEFTAKEWLDKNEFGDIDSAVDLIIEYAPDHGFPDNTDGESILFEEATYTPQGNVVLNFSYETVEDEDIDEDEEDDSQDPDGSEGEDL